MRLKKSTSKLETAGGYGLFPAQQGRVLQVSLELQRETGL
jgi:hypothetical protein